MKKSTSIVEFVVIVFFCVSVFNTLGLFVCFGVEGCEANLSVGINCPRGLR